MKNLLLILILILFIISCQDETKINKHPIKIIYFKDDKVNLCYAYVWVGDHHGGPTMTNVPCESVEKYLDKRPW